MARIMAAVNRPLQPSKFANEHITAIRPIVSATVSQYLPTCDGFSRNRASSPSTASNTPLAISNRQATITSPCSISQAENSANERWRLVIWRTETGFVLRNRAKIRARGRPHSDRSTAVLSPYFLFDTDTPLPWPKLGHS